MKNILVSMTVWSALIGCSTDVVQSEEIMSTEQNTTTNEISSENVIEPVSSEEIVIVSSQSSEGRQPQSSGAKDGVISSQEQSAVYESSAEEAPKTSEIPVYSEGEKYQAGDRVELEGVVYECKAGVTAAWCSNAAYIPGGLYSNEAWSVIAQEDIIEYSSIEEGVASSNSNETSSELGVSSPSESSGSVEGTSVVSQNGMWSPWTKRNFKKTVIGYYASWQWYDRAKKAAPENIDFSKWTRVNFAFFHPSSNGTLHVTDDWADPQVLFGPANWNPQDSDTELCVSKMSVGSDTGSETCGYYQIDKGLVELAHKAGTEVWPSIGGWTLSDKFSAIAASPTSREAFAQECVRILREYNFDGIDIDWEYPGYAEHSGTASDKENFILFLQAIKDAITVYGNSLTPQRIFGLTAALPCGTSIINEGIDVPALNTVLTEFNLMTYDFHGAFDSKVDHNAPLYTSGIHPESPRFSVQGCVDNYIERGAVASRLNVGGGFYGRSFAGATELGGAHSGNDEAHWTTDEGMPMYYNIQKELQSGALTRHWDAVAQVPYATFIGGGLVSYEDEESMGLKADYINENQLGGIIIWEMSGDIQDDLSTPLIDVLHEALNK